MRPRRALAVVLCLALPLTGCTTSRTLPLPLAQTGAAPSAQPAASTVRVGDHLRVHTRDGRHTDLVLDHVAADGDIFGNHQEHLVAATVAMVEHRSINKTRTTLLIAGVGFSVLLLAIVIDLATSPFLAY